MSMYATGLTDPRAIFESAQAAFSENLMPFWANNAWDEQYGGFLTRLDRQGHRLEDHEKILIMQARMIASLSFAHGHGIQHRGYLELAGRGFDFLVQNFWDRETGGFHFSVDRQGIPLCTRKNTDFHAYTLIGLAEYYRVSQRPEALDWCHRVFDVLTHKAADGEWGYVEDFDGAEWDPLNADQMNLEGQRFVKTIDMHTNIMEALTYLARITRDPDHLTALRRVVELVVAKGLDPDYGGSITVFDREWHPLKDALGNATTSYGINVEIAWLLGEAASVLGEPWDIYRRPIVTLIDHALIYGFDHERGGLANYGPMQGHVLAATHLPANRLIKPWWTQAEMMNALMDAYIVTRNPKYWQAFTKLVGWIWNHQIDHQYGDWYMETDWHTGQPTSTDKGGEWKTAFHAGRALVRTTQTLARLLRESRADSLQSPPL
ncbi:MAG: N-acylglucosamine 2-epimerase [Candidatus Hydrogenedentota bacterium]